MNGVGGEDHCEKPGETDHLQSWSIKALMDDFIEGRILMFNPDYLLLFWMIDPVHIIEPPGLQQPCQLIGGRDRLRQTQPVPVNPIQSNPINPIGHSEREKAESDAKKIARKSESRGQQNSGRARAERAGRFLNLPSLASGCFVMRVFCSLLVPFGSRTLLSSECFPG